MLARSTDIRRAMERLKGFMLGIAIDGRINDKEIQSLKDWLSIHPTLSAKEPFLTVSVILHRIFEDNYIDEEEREEILELCGMFDDDSMATSISVSVIGVLHGVLHGIIADGNIGENEVIGLKNWLKVHSQLKDYWPVCEAWNLVERIMSDGVVDEGEKKELLEFCKSFTEIPIKAPILKDEIYNQFFMKSGAPIIQPITAICDRNHQIDFKDKSFCFTGPARYGQRSELNEMVRALNGIPKNTVSARLDYLVIGAQSSPAWFFSTYGRKIEKAMNLKNESRADTVILFEDDFVDQVGRSIASDNTW